MNLRSIPFVIPKEFIFDHALGDVQRFGAILESVETGRIVGHVQETGMLQSLAQTVMAGPGAPVGMASQIFSAGTGFVQNEQIKTKIDVMQDMMGSLQTVQIASLITSVAGIGVTVASTAILLNRMGAIQRDVRDIAGRIDGLPAKLREMDLEKTMTDVETQIDRLAEAPHRRDSDHVVATAEAILHEKHAHLVEGTRRIVIEAEIDESMLRALLSAIALCSAAQSRSLFWLDHKETARDRATRQARALRELAFDMPKDKIAARLSTGREGADRISALASETRFRIASMPSLGQRLIDLDVHGRDYIEQATDEQDQPLLILPAAD